MRYLAWRKSLYLKSKKKRWFELIAPKIFNNTVIGETLLTEPKLMLGRTVVVNLMNITRDIKKQDINVKFKVTDVQGDKGITELIDYELSPSSIKRMVRRGKDKIDDSFVAQTLDKKNIRIKILVLTKGKTNGSVLTSIRQLIRAFVISEIEKSDYENLLYNILSHKLQNALKAEAKKIYPLKFCEVRRLCIEHGKVKLTKKPAIEKIIEEAEETEEEKIIEKVKEKKEKKEEDDILLKIDGLDDELKEKQFEKKPKRKQYGN